MNNVTGALLAALAGLVTAGGAQFILSGGALKKSLYAILPLCFGLVCAVQWERFEWSGHVMGYTLLAFLAVASVMDLRERSVPNRLMKVMLVIWVLILGTVFLWNSMQGISLLLGGLCGAAFSGGVFLLVYVLSHKKLGGADVKMAAVMGLYLTGARIVGAVFYGVLLCALYSLSMLAFKKLGKQDAVPLIPFLACGTLITLCIVI